jgi:hypothetical protein
MSASVFCVYRVLLSLVMVVLGVHFLQYNLYEYFEYDVDMSWDAMMRYNIQRHLSRVEVQQLTVVIVPLLTLEPRRLQLSPIRLWLR